MALPRLSDDARLLAELIAIPSVNPDGLPGTDRTGEKEIATFLAKHLRKLGADCELQPVQKDRPNLIAVFPLKRRPRARILLAPHTDTVSVGGMTVPPFSPVVRQGKLYGRGATDTKGSIAAMLTAIAQVLKKAYRNGTVEITFAGLMGEEARNQGAVHYARTCPKFNLAIIGEPTGLKLVHAHKGTAWFTVRAAGKSAHASNPSHGRNAIRILSEFIQFGLPRIEAALAEFRHPSLGHATISPGLLRGGTKVNIVPASAELDLDVRLVPALSAHQATQLLRQVARSLSPHLTVTLTPGVPALEADPDHPWIRRILPATRGLSSVPWCCDATIFAQRGIPSVAFGPGSIAQAHTVDEFLALDDLAAGTAAYGRILTLLLAP
ncbi:MAG: M20/M25/M40 family metallo-hydrolase [Verrucomicrobiia bacterium]